MEINMVSEKSNIKVKILRINNMMLLLSEKRSPSLPEVPYNIIGFHVLSYLKYSSILSRR